MKVSLVQLVKRADDLLQRKEYASSSQLCQRIIEQRPSCHEAVNILGVVALRLKDDKQACAYFQQALKLDANNGLYWSNLAVACRNLGRLDAAERAAALAIKSAPKSPTGYNILAEAKFKQGSLRESLTCLQKSFAMHQTAEVASQAAGILQKLKRESEAVAYLNKAIEINGKHLPAYISLAHLLCLRGRFKEVIALCQNAERNGLSDERIQTFHGTGYYGLYEVGKAVDYYKKALSINPEYKGVISSLADAAAHTCDWDFAEERETAAMKLIEDSLESKSTFIFQPFTAMRMGVSPKKQKQIAERFVSLQHPSGKAYEAKPRQTKKGKLRLGYVSSDLRDHPVFHLAKNLFQGHNRDLFEVFVYSTGPNDGSDYRRHAKETCDHFADIANISDTQAIQQIKSDQIDILVDMNGLTTMNRLGVFSPRPAPLQMHFLGYPGTTGAPFIDYFVTDHFLSPEGSEDDFSEKLIYMPHTYQICDDDKLAIPEPTTRKEQGLPDDGFVFCSFNTNYKIDRHVFACWMRILKRVPDSALWLMERPAIAIENLRKTAEAEGVDPQRIITANKVGKLEHLARHSLADLFLDTHLVCGHTTANDALQMGLPVIAYPAESFISRVSGSLLKAHGLEELICSSYEEYEELAVSLAKDKSRLDGLKEKLLNDGPNVPARNAKVFVENLEKAYRKAWQIHEQGKPPEHIDVVKL